MRPPKSRPKKPAQKGVPTRVPMYYANVDCIYGVILNQTYKKLRWDIKMRPPKCRPKKAFQQGIVCIMQRYTAYVVSFFLEGGVIGLSKAEHTFP